MILHYDVITCYL